MVDIAQLVSASDCGSEGRGFESHYPPQKKEALHSECFFFLGWIMGFERPAPVRKLVQKVSGGHFLGRGRIPFFPDARRRRVDGKKLVA